MKLVLGLAFTLVMTVLTLLVVNESVGVEERVLQWTAAPGIVIGLDNPEVRGKTRHIMRYRYKAANGRDYEGQVDVPEDTWSRAHIGQEVAVRHEPADAERHVAIPHGIPALKDWKRPALFFALSLLGLWYTWAHRPRARAAPSPPPPPPPAPPAT